MKGVKTIIDMKVNENQIANWRNFKEYDKNTDSIMGTCSPSTWYPIIDNLFHTLGKSGDYVTISFDAKGACRVGGWGLAKENFVKCSAGGSTRTVSDHGIILFASSESYRRVWVTYKLLADTGPRFIIAIGYEGGTLQIRNLKVELSDHPTDYEE